MNPFSPLRLVIFIVVLSLLIAFVQVGILTLAFDKLGLSASSGFTLLFASLFGSAINLPLFSVTSQPAPISRVPPSFQGLLRHMAKEFTGRTIVAVNVGGALIPVMFSVYLLRHTALSLGTTALAVAIVSAICYVASRPLAGIGIGMPVFIAPFTAAIVAIVLAPQHSAPLAYICGTLGVLIGADLLRLKDIKRLGAPFASIGGAGTFDGIFITGIIAVLLA